MNNNVGSVEVAEATKHRDPKSLLGYIRKDDNSHGAAALGVSNAALGRDFSIARVKFDTDPDEGNENSHSSSASMLNSNVNNNLSNK